ncbi:tRNA(Met) cytidine acetyltransferase [Desulfurococcaceae archaeon MEX13E-LK6-19]|nr:tRNA(Met) cytidine acetyltransferase [Desulfurococcaceae archaeon MEX13E-LK6-19]
MVITDFIAKACRHGWRALVVSIGSINDLAMMLKEEDLRIGLCISRQEKSIEQCGNVVGFREAHRLIGGEYESVALFLEGVRGWPGNLLAAVTELVSSHGFFLVQVPRELASTRFGRYFIDCARSSRNVLVIDNGRVIYRSIVEDKPVYPAKPRPVSKDRFVRRLEELAVNEEQARVIRIYPRFLYGSEKLFLIHGDRGRGKSSIMGLLAAYTMVRKPGRYIVTSHSLVSVQSFFRMLVKGLEKLSVKPLVYKKKDLIQGVSTGSSSIKYVEPWLVREDSGKPLFVDEAAGVGVARVRRWYRRVGKLVASSTIHGYEGSGRVLLKLLNEYFRRSIVMKLVYPVRYPPQDPLEEFLYKVFHLDAEPPEIREVAEPLNYKTIRQQELASNYDLLRKVYGLLVTAHYRNEPDDLVLLLDTDYFDLRVVIDSMGNVVAVAQLRVEEALPGTEPSKLADLGYRIVDKLDRYGIYERVTGTRIWRIVRIAVTPPLQRKGIGSRLLNYIENEASEKNISAIAAIFSGFNIIRFWLKNNYTPIYISPRYNRITGEKNIIVLKPLDGKWKNIEEVLGKIMFSTIHYAGHILFRDLSAEKTSTIMRYLMEKGLAREIGIEVTCKRLEKYLEGNLYHESIVDILYNYIKGINIEDVNDQELLLITARLIQGKTISDIAKILGKQLKQTEELVEKTMRKLAQQLHSTLCHRQ